MRKETIGNAFIDTETKETNAPYREPLPQVLKLSAAIRIGALYRPQCFGVISDGRGTCALGAAIEGLWGFGSVHAGKNCAHLDEVYSQHYPHGHIVYRNDTLKWTREEIADWLESRGL